MMLTKKKIDWGTYVFFIPATVIYLSVIVWPVLYSFFISLFKWNGIGKKVFVGLDNYRRLLFDDSVFLQALRNNLTWIFLALVLTTVLALSLALVLNRHFLGRALFRGIFYYPCVLAAIAASLTWRWMYDPNIGFINEFARLIGSDFAQHWISDPKTSLYAVFAASLWNGVGQTMILFLAGLQTVSKDALEAAMIDGANAVTRFVHITVPYLRETFIIVFATLIIAAMKVYDVIKGLTDGGPNHATEMLSTYMYSQSFRYNNVGIGTTISCVMVLIMLVVIIPYISFTAREN